MRSRAQLLLEDSENFLTRTITHLRSSTLWKTLAALTFFTIIFLLLGLIFGLFAVNENHNQIEVLPQPAPNKAPPEDKIEDLRKNSFIKPLIDYYEDRVRRSFMYKSKIPFATKVFKYGRNIDKLIPILKESSHENKYITRSVLKKLRHKRDIVEPIDLNPLEVDYLLLKTQIRDKRSEIKLTALEMAYNRCKKEASPSECKPLFLEMYELAKDIHKNSGIMAKMLKDTKKVLKEKSSSEEQEHNKQTLEKSEDVTKQNLEESKKLNGNMREKNLVGTHDNAKPVNQTDLTIHKNTENYTPQIRTEQLESSTKFDHIFDLPHHDGNHKENKSSQVTIEIPTTSTDYTDIKIKNITENYKFEITTKPSDHSNSTQNISESIKIEKHMDTTSPKFIKNIESTTSLSTENNLGNSTKIEITTKSSTHTDEITSTYVSANNLSEKSTESIPNTKNLDLSDLSNKDKDHISTKIPIELNNHHTKTEYPNTTSTEHTQIYTTVSSTKSEISTKPSVTSTTSGEHSEIHKSNSTVIHQADSTSTPTTTIESSTSSSTNANANHKSTKISTENSTDAHTTEKLQTETTSKPSKILHIADALLSKDNPDKDKVDQPTILSIVNELITPSVVPAETQTPSTILSAEVHTSTHGSQSDKIELTTSSPHLRNMEIANSDFSKDTHSSDKSQPNSEENKIEESENMYKKIFQGPIEAYPIAPKFHEDMHVIDKSYKTLNPEDQNDLISLAEKWHKKNLNTNVDYQFLENFNSLEMARDAKIGHTSGISNPIPASGPFMTLCDQFNKNKHDTKTTILPTINGFTNSASNHFTSRGPGGFPVTGESMKASAQFFYNPNFGVPSVPICFYATPYNMQMFNNKQNMGGYWSPNVGPSGFNQHSGFGGGFYPFHPNMGNMQQGVSPGPYGHTSTASAQHNFNANNKNFMQQSQPFFCTYMPNSQHGQFNNNFNVRMRDANQNLTEFKKYPNIPSPTDTIYASYANQMAALARDDAANHCIDPDTIACFATHQCIAKSKWCDSVVDCMDASDESACSCKVRLPETRLCDGYSDCPLGEDETGCFGCDKSMFSCYNNQEEYLRAGNSTISMCYSTINKCDGDKNCLNGNDEKDCNIIVSPLGNPVTHSKSYTEGYLHRNHKGKWYPVCGNSEKWAREACESESGQLGDQPQIDLQTGVIPGPFIHPSTSSHGQDFIETCKQNSENVVVHVKCPELKCGRVIESQQYTSTRKRRSIKNTTIELERDRLKRQDDRVVGGALCNSTEWPFIVALYRNGKFHCGGIIYDDQWIITAAHCVINFRKYYFEVHAGLLRRSSYSASVQISKVTHVIVHHKYDRLNMKNDLALLRMENHLKFNRYLRPPCMPEQKRTVGLFGDNWLSGPKEGTICTAVGWGAVRERGPGSDHLRQVQIPIMKLCKTKQDKEAYNICAGEPNGGRDACQGDSGGPLFCQSVSDPKEWYLAGVISHGEGCARAGEPGVYTRVALYLAWIQLAKMSDNIPHIQPLQSCPGFVCIWGGAKCIEGKKRCDRIVDCLGGEDEVGCVYNTIPDVGSVLGKNFTESPMTLSIEESDDLTATETVNMEVSQIDIGSSDKLKLDKDSIKKFEKLQIAPVTNITTEKENEVSTTTTNKMDTNTAVTENFTIKAKDLLESTTEHSKNSSTTVTPHQNTTTEEIFSNAEKFIKNLFSNTENSSITVPTTTESLHHSKSQNLNGSTKNNEFSNISGGDLPVTKLDEGVANIKHGEIKKRENATDSNIEQNTKTKLNIHKAASKFMCTRIPQSIDISNKCDRILDCEDGTDEEDCTCRDYLKGTLNILVCDGKTDCEDLTDEENCGNCSSTEFHCPLSKRCIQSVKRCDDTIDCAFKEDELDCFALTNGKKVFLDANKRPHIKESGIFSRNKNGIWRIICSNEANIHTNSSSVDNVCSLLGFNGHKFYNTTKIYNEGDEIESIIDDISIKERGASEKIQRFEEIARVSGDSNSNCDALYVECQPSSNAQKPIIKTHIQPASKTLIKDHEKLNPIIKPEQKPSVVMRPNISALVLVHQDSNWKLEDIVKPLLHSNATDTKVEKLTEDVHHYPWSVNVYTNGKLICNGVLLDKYWVAVHTKCVDAISLIDDYVAVLLGGGKTNYNSKGADEQIRHVNCIKYVENSNIKLIHLHYPVQLTRYVMPTFLHQKTTKDIEFKSKQHKCMSVTHDKFDRIKTFDVKESFDNPICNGVTSSGNETHHEHSYKLCFENDIEINKELKSLLCDDKKESHNEKYGLIVCQEDNSGWYPKTFYSYKSSSCNINNTIIGDDLGKCHKKIQQIIDLNKCDYPFIDQPFCPTLMRCPLGECLPTDKICNGKIDCYDGSDENSKLCNIQKQSCRPSEFKCKNGNCVSKAKFCDHINDCGDLSDEPTVCSCFTYLKATDPLKICDGIRNCWDKSDENPAYCNCTNDKFRCGKSDECIPHDFLCDKQRDCPNGEDETFCLGVELPSIPYTASDGYGQVIEQSYGIWHTKCFPRHQPAPNSTEITKICNKLGYKHTNNPKYRFIDNEIEEENNNDKVNEYRTLDGSKDIITKLDNNNKNQTILNEHERKASSKYLESTKAVIVNQFSPLKLNEKLMIFMKPSRPIAELVKWNASDLEKCYRLEIKCE